ncbi:MAG: hypothetical protein M3460_15750 [Actinomycetota bacterium]|nr:hypothetical protein [Actinomycetota bacterium]
MKQLPGAVVIAGLLFAAGCGGNFVDQAREDGLTVTDPAGAHYTVNRICQNMDRGARVPVDVLTSLPGGDSSNELHLVKLGVAEQCPQHNDVYARVLQVLADAEAAAEQVEVDYRNSDPNFNVGPDGYCTATPCGSNGKLPEGHQP